MKRLGRSLLPLEIQPCSDGSKVTVLLEPIELGHLAIGDKLLGPDRLYEILFKRGELSRKRVRIQKQ